MNQQSAPVKPAGPQPDRITPEEFRATFRTIMERLDQIEAELSCFKEGVATAAEHSHEIPGETISFHATTLVVGYDDNGNPTYKVKGGQYQKFGVRVWPEVLPDLGLDPAKLKPGPNPINLNVVAIMGEKGPRKVIGLAMI